MTADRPRRLIYRDPVQLEPIAERSDPFARREAAHASAGVLLRAGQAADDPQVTRRLVQLVDQVGLPTLADLWADSPARSLPGALYRLYVLREWMTRFPDEAARDYAAGIVFAEPHHSVAGVDPAGPHEVRQVADRILAGAFSGDVAVALYRAASLCRVVVAGRADTGSGLRSALEAAKLKDMADDLEASARLWTDGRLD